MIISLGVPPTHTPDSQLSGIANINYERVGGTLGDAWGISESLNYYYHYFYHMGGFNLTALADVMAASDWKGILKQWIF